MKSFPFLFEVTIFWYDNDEKKGHTEKYAGVGSCNSFTDAMRQIEQKYGEEIVSIDNLTSIGECEYTEQTIIPIKKEWVSNFINEDSMFWNETEIK